LINTQGLAIGDRRVMPGIFCKTAIGLLKTSEAAKQQSAAKSLAET
jgi:hypothetical protein